MSATNSPAPTRSVMSSKARIRPPSNSFRTCSQTTSVPRPVGLTRDRSGRGRWASPSDRGRSPTPGSCGCLTSRRTPPVRRPAPWRAPGHPTRCRGGSGAAGSRQLRIAGGSPRDHPGYRSCRTVRVARVEHADANSGFRPQTGTCRHRAPPGAGTTHRPVCVGIVPPATRLDHIALFGVGQITMPSSSARRPAVGRTGTAPRRGGESAYCAPERRKSRHPPENFTGGYRDSLVIRLQCTSVG